MDREAAIEILRAHQGALRRRGVRHAAVFGSVARGDSHAASDLDIMIDIDGEAVGDVYGYVGLCRFIEELFPARVDVANRDTLKEAIRMRADSDAVAAF